MTRYLPSLFLLACSLVGNGILWIQWDHQKKMRALDDEIAVLQQRRINLISGTAKQWEDFSMYQRSQINKLNADYNKLAITCYGH
jgi:hypothetical protein